MKYILILLFLSQVLMASELKKTVKESGGDYTSLEACLNDNEQDLVTNTYNLVVEISGTWSTDDSTAVLIDGYTTSATYDINIYTTGDSCHDGKSYGSNSTAYRLNQGGYLVYTINCKERYVTINGLQIKSGGNTYRSCISVTGGADPVTIKNCILNSAPTNGGDGVYIRSASVNIYNNMINVDDDGIENYDTTSSSYTLNYYNNTLISCVGNGFKNRYSTGAIINCKNNLVLESASTCYYTGSSDWNTFTNNGSSDTSGSSGLQNLTIADELENTTTDFHLKEGADSIDAGTSLSGTFTDDIDGDTRGSSWDIGCDEYVSGTTEEAVRRHLLFIN